MFQRDRKLLCLKLFALILLTGALSGCGGGSERQRSSRPAPTGPGPARSVTSDSASGSGGSTTGGGSTADSGADLAHTPPAEGAEAGWGDLVGRITFDGTPPRPERITPDKDPEYCGKHELVRESLIVNPENKGIANVLVGLYLSRGEEPPQAHPTLSADTSTPRMDNEFCRFSPHFFICRAGQTVILGNKDEVAHNMNIATKDNPQQNPVLPPRVDIEHTFENAESRPSPVSCNIHPWMQGYLLVVDHPYAVVTDEDGRFEIPKLPVGEWRFQFWQEKAGYVSEVNVGGKSRGWSKGRVTLPIKEGTNDLGEIRVSPALFQ